MKVSYKWLLELTGLDWPAEELGDRLTLCGTACEYIDHLAEHMNNVFVAEVHELNPIEGADKIRLATVDTGEEKLDVVCGAPNVAAGQKIALARIGAELAGGMKIKKTKIRGIESVAMICSERELGMSDDHAGILVLGDDAKVGQPLVEYLDFDDYRLTFELTPNRPDSMCAIGIARDMAALASTKLVRPEFELKESDEAASDHVSITIDAPDACPRYAARIVRGIKVGESPWWLKRKLIAAGVRPISNAVDISNLVMLECGQPLHAFDLDRFGSNEVVVRKALDGEKFTTLDGKEHKLVPDNLMITNGKESVATGGVMGGLDSEVENDTVNILLEAAHFESSMIRRSRRHLGLVTEASQRFEKGADPNVIEYALDRAAFLFAELCGGTVLKGIVDCYPEPIEPREVTMRPSRCNQLLGTDISSERMVQIFNDLEFQATDGDPIKVMVPTYRPDIEREVDLIEEVVRIEGFDAVEDSISSTGPLYTRILPEDRFRRELRSVLTGSGFDEILTTGLVHSRVTNKLVPGVPQVELANNSSEELDIMRNSMVPSTLEVVRHNLSHRNIDLRLFEIGKTYLPGDEKADQWTEDEYLVLTVTGRTQTSWRDKPREQDFYDLTGALKAITTHFRHPEMTFEPEVVACFDDEVSFKVKLNGSQVGRIGSVSKKALRVADIKQPVYLAELAIAPLMEGLDKFTEFEPLPTHPAALRDLSLMLDAGVRAGEVLQVAKKAAGPLAEAVEIFDLYQGKQIEKGKKSLALSIRYRSDERSLQAEEVEAAQQSVVSKLKKEFNAEVRDK